MSGPSTTDRPVAWILSVPANITHARIIQSLVLELPSVHVLNAPETSGSHSGSLRTSRGRHGWCGGRGHGARCEGAQEAGQKGHRRVREGDDKGESEELQGWVLRDLYEGIGVKSGGSGGRGETGEVYVVWIDFGIGFRICLFSIIVSDAMITTDKSTIQPHRWRAGRCLSAVFLL